MDNDDIDALLGDSPEKRSNDFGSPQNQKKPRLDRNGGRRSREGAIESRVKEAVVVQNMAPKKISLVR